VRTMTNGFVRSKCETVKEWLECLCPRKAVDAEKIRTQWSTSIRKPEASHLGLTVELSKRILVGERKPKLVGSFLTQ
jgi:hypothetical protein